LYVSLNASQLFNPLTIPDLDRYLQSYVTS